MDKFLLDSGTRQELDTDSMPTNTNMAVESVDSQDNEQLNTGSSSRPRTILPASVTAIVTNFLQSTGTLLGLRTRSNDASAYEEIDNPSVAYFNNPILASSEVVAKSSSNKQPQSKRSRSSTSKKL